MHATLAVQNMQGRYICVASRNLKRNRDNHTLLMIFYLKKIYHPRELRASMTGRNDWSTALFQRCAHFKR